ncbi:hypothetical protein SpCBS45565_g08039 [Spizellomyces sp. 'palustris']|nr:hypothetical protein SpCBS45565_g08039 [Spizellomyces sp. 'palustris']
MRSSEQDDPAGEPGDIVLNGRDEQTSDLDDSHLMVDGGAARDDAGRRRLSWSGESGSESSDDKLGVSSEKPASGLMLRKVPSFSALRTNPAPNAARSTLPVRHNPLPSAHHNNGPYPHNYHPHHISPTPLPTRVSNTTTSVPVPATTARSSTPQADPNRRLAKFKSGDSIKSLMGVLADGDRDRELVVETDAALQGLGRPPLFKTPTAPVKVARAGKMEEDAEEFVWSGSPDPHKVRSKRSFSNHLLPAPHDPPPGIAPIAASTVPRPDGLTNEYLPPPSVTNGSNASANADLMTPRSQGPKLKKSSEFKALPKRSGQPAAPFLPMSSGHYGATSNAAFSQAPAHAIADVPVKLTMPSYRQSPVMTPTLQGPGEGSAYMQYAGQGSFDSERAYLLGTKRHEFRRQSLPRDIESSSDFERPKGRSFVLSVGCLVFVALTLFAMVAFCIQPLTNLSILRVGNIHGTLSIFEFDMTLSATNENIIPAYVDELDLDVFVGGGLESENVFESDESNSTVALGKELLGHIRRVTPTTTFTPLSRTNANTHIAIHDPENTLGRVIYMRFPYTLTVRGSVTYSSLWWFQFVETVDCVTRVEASGRTDPGRTWICHVEGEAEDHE